MPSPSVFIIFGAAVWPGGQPSNAMRRRVAGALKTANGRPDALYLVTGGIGKHPPSEAAVMASLLQEAGIAPQRILLDEAATDTLESIANCARILKSLPAFGDVFVSSDTYHIPRCRLLFRLFGVSTLAAGVESGRPQNRLARWLYYYLREFAAIPWDVFLGILLLLRSRNL